MKPSAGIALEVGLTLALLWLAISGLLNLRHEWAAQSNWRVQLVAGDDYRPSKSPLFPSLGGIAADGFGAAMTSKPHDTYHFVAFIIHGASLNSDIALWAQVQQLLAAKRGLRLVAYCDGSACVGDFTVGALKPPFPVIGCAEYRTARVLLHADVDHRALVLDGNLAALGSVVWDSASSPSGVAAAITRLM